MKITVRQKSVTIDGYVNAVDRFSRTLYDNIIGRFIEKILPNVFKRAIKKADNIKVLLNHNETRELADTKSGTAKIYEDNVGLRAIVQITDPEVIEKARAGKLRGWSFGFDQAEDERNTNDKGIIERTIKKLRLHEVSILDDNALPAYIGTSIEARSFNNNDITVRMSSDTVIDTDIEQEQDDNKETPQPTTKTDNEQAEQEAKEKAETLKKDQEYREQVIRECSI